MANPKLRTKHNYDAFEVVSALQKCIRRGLEEDALYWAYELAESRNKNYSSWLWTRLKVIACEDVGPAIGLRWICTRLRVSSMDFLWPEKSMSGRISSVCPPLATLRVQLKFWTPRSLKPVLSRASVRVTVYSSGFIGRFSVPTGTVPTQLTFLPVLSLGLLLP
jgi:hypothetical protein